MKNPKRIIQFRRLSEIQSTDEGGACPQAEHNVIPEMLKTQEGSDGCFVKQGFLECKWHEQTFRNWNRSSGTSVKKPSMLINSTTPMSGESSSYANRSHEKPPVQGAFSTLARIAQNLLLLRLCGWAVPLFDGWVITCREDQTFPTVLLYSNAYSLERCRSTLSYQKIMQLISLFAVSFWNVTSAGKKTCRPPATINNK